jgi:RNA polymerase sigma-70 factor (ECF subfamily)
VTHAAGENNPVDLASAACAASDGDREAFRTLYREVQPGLLRYLRGLVGDDAEDVASEAWLQITRDIRTFRDQGAGFRAWATSIARNRGLDHLRHRGRRPATPVPVHALADLAGLADAAEEAITAGSTRAAIALIATLPQDQAEAILLRVVVGLDANEAARVLGKRPGAVRTAAWRGLRRLAAQLDQGRVEGLSTDDPPAQVRPIRSGDIGNHRRVTQLRGPTPEDMR